MDASGVIDLLCVGAYSRALNECMHFNSRDAEMRALSHRCHIALGQSRVVIQQLEAESKSSPMALPLRSVYLLAQYTLARERGDSSEIEALVENVRSLVIDESVASDLAISATSSTVLSSILMSERHYDLAVRLLSSKLNGEMAAMLAEIYLRLSRLDIAESFVKKLDEDSVASQMAVASVYVSIGDAKSAREARLIYEELIQRFGETHILLNGLAACSLVLGDANEGEKSLLSALGKRANDVQTMSNLVVSSVMGNKPSEYIERYTSQLEKGNPESAWVKAFRNQCEIFDSESLSLSYGAS